MARNTGYILILSVLRKGFIYELKLKHISLQLHPKSVLMILKVSIILHHVLTASSEVLLVTSKDLCSQRCCGYNMTLVGRQTAERLGLAVNQDYCRSRHSEEE